MANKPPTITTGSQGQPYFRYDDGWVTMWFGAKEYRISDHKAWELKIELDHAIALLEQAREA